MGNNAIGEAREVCGIDVTKHELNSRIAEILGIRPPKLSTGSTESKELFVQVNEVLGLGLDNRLSKPELARAICEIAGEAWSPECESRGSTVTLSGLTSVCRAVVKLTS